MALLAQTSSSRPHHHHTNESNEIGSDRKSTTIINNVFKFLLASLLLIDLALLNKELSKSDERNALFLLSVLLVFYLKVAIFERYLRKPRQLQLVVSFMQNEKLLLLEPTVDNLTDSISSDLDDDYYYYYYYYYSNQQQFNVLFLLSYVSLLLFFMLHLKPPIKNYLTRFRYNTISFILIQCKFLKILSKRNLVRISFVKTYSMFFVI
jgi:hypothetical protein